MKNSKIKVIAIALMLIGTISSCGTTKSSSTSDIGNMVAKMQVKEPIEGVCDNANVIAILPFPGNGQIKAKAPKTDEEIITALNAKVNYIKDKPNYEDKGMVSLIVNCKGEMVQCKIDNKTKSSTLDSEIVAVFAEMKVWTAGTVNKKPFDTVVLYSFTIKDGKIAL